MRSIERSFLTLLQKVTSELNIICINFYYEYRNNRVSYKKNMKFEEKICFRNANTTFIKIKISKKIKNKKPPIGVWYHVI